VTDIPAGTTSGTRRLDGARLPELDGVRALAVLGVIASHSGLFGLGWLGVDVFFGLSGYLMANRSTRPRPTSRRRVNTGSLTRLTGIHAAMVGRSGFSDGCARVLNSSVQVLKPAACTALSSSSFGAYAGWNRRR